MTGLTVLGLCSCLLLGLAGANPQSAPTTFKGCVDQCQPDCGERCAELGSFGMSCAITWPKNENNFCRCTSLVNGDIPICGVNGSGRPAELGSWFWKAALIKLMLAFFYTAY